MHLIALIEDSPAEAELIQEYCKRFCAENSVNIDVKWFPKGEAFLRDYQPIYDLVLMDINLPALNGMDTAARLRRLDSRQYIVLSDLLLPCGSRLTQIDHVVVSVYGIFVIETKNYHGTISGSIWKEFWVQECHGRQYDLRNPFRQNYAHVQALASLLGLERDCFFSVVAFADDAVLQVVQPEDSTEQLVPISKVCRAVRRRKQPLLLWDDVRYYAGVILCANIEDPQAREQHLSQIDDEIAYRRFALRRGLCPRCGGKLVLRQGRYGSFYGCTNYPECRYTLENEV